MSEKLDFDGDEFMNELFKNSKNKNEAYVQKFDFTIFDNELIHNLNGFVVKTRKLLCLLGIKRYVFQVEKCPTTEKLHIQGRVLFIKRTRVSTLVKRCLSEGYKIHWSVTSNGCREFSYVMKEESRVHGPYSDNQNSTIDTEGLNFYPWQKNLIEWVDVYEPRKIDIIYDPTGNIGKTTITKYLGINKNAMIIPAFNDSVKVMQHCCSCYNTIKGNVFIVDMPKAMCKEKLGQLYSVIENIKSGILYDTRYNSKQIFLDPPRVYVFTNTLPDLNLLSLDRWNLLGINEKKEFFNLDVDAIIAEQLLAFVNRKLKT